MGEKKRRGHLDGVGRKEMEDWARAAKRVVAMDEAGDAKRHAAEVIALLKRRGLSIPQVLNALAAAQTAMVGVSGDLMTGVLAHSLLDFWLNALAEQQGMERERPH